MTDHETDADLRCTFDALGLITDSSLMSSVLRQARKAALASDVTVLVEGETGTGKQVLAQAIHGLDTKRNAFPFITVHCGTINEALAESELFGHTRGAFSGAAGERLGLFQAAHKGTLFLDDVNDLPLPLQAKLLDVIQRGVVRPVGSDHEKTIDVRIVAASNQELKQMVSLNRFRPDLYHRLNVVRLFLPPLRSRKQDLAKLLLILAHRHCDLYQPIHSVDTELLQLLASHTFPGNVRELENAVQRMLFSKVEGSSLSVLDWMRQAAPEAPEAAEPQNSAQPALLDEAAAIVWKAISSGLSYKLAIRELEKKLLETASQVTGGTRREVADLLQTSERTLYYKMRGLQ